MPKCSQCDQPCAQDGHSEYCVDHSWLCRKVRLCQLGAYVLLVLNVGAIALFPNVYPVILIGVICINGAIQQTLAFFRTVGNCMKRLGKAVCCVPTAKLYQINP